MAPISAVQYGILINSFFFSIFARPINGTYNVHLAGNNLGNDGHSDGCQRKRLTALGLGDRLGRRTAGNCADLPWIDGLFSLQSICASCDLFGLAHDHDRAPTFVGTILDRSNAVGKGWCDETIQRTENFLTFYVHFTVYGSNFTLF